MIACQFEDKVGYTPIVSKLSSRFYNGFVIDKTIFLILSTLGDKLKTNFLIFYVTCDFNQISLIVLRPLYYTVTAVLKLTDKSGIQISDVPC